jgi:hypothetical protein
MIAKLWNWVRGYKQYFIGIAIITVNTFGVKWGLTEDQIAWVNGILGGAVLANKVGNKIIPETTK